ncbi:uncharacterized protein [Rutidosis leptorrhynchoides]|uniref:uncharacterized protein n=1 Tax=Rutidosis leptorrhynchoides TaxID=125765 RepID=UPI003A9A095F
MVELKNKGKIFPSPTPPSNGDYLSFLKLLPAAIFTIVSVLSLEDREVFAYMITNSMKTTAAASKPIDSKRSRSSKKGSPANGGGGGAGAHKPPVFDCDCFECYRSYWIKWDSSPNRELIHQAIEAFEEHLTKGESEKSKKSPRTSKRRDKSNRRVADKPADVLGQHEKLLPVVAEDIKDISFIEEVEKDSSFTTINVSLNNGAGSSVNDSPLPEPVNVDEGTVIVQRTAASGNSHKGLARKVLPDVLGLFNSRLWNLWGPNV